jgi:nucleoside-diphosphate-sugar epimerase
MTLLIFGNGYTAQVVMRQPGLAGFVTYRGAKPVVPHGFTAVPFNDAAQYIVTATTILSTVPPVNGQDPVLASYAPLLKGKFCLYCSATNVYGDYQGGWVNEESACTPTGRGVVRLALEQQWQALGNAAILRLSGIYGAGHSVFERLQQPHYHQAGHVFSRMHVDDIASIIKLLYENPQPALYNLADDMPENSYTVACYAASLLGMPPPPLADAPTSAMQQEFFQQHKRVSNKKIRLALGYNLRYPSYKQGLKAIMQQGIS